MPQGHHQPLTFAQLLARYGARASDPDVTIVSLSACLSSGHDPGHILAYVAGLGHTVATLDDLLATINDLDGEEELGAFRVRDGGVAVSIASHGAFVLFRP